MTRPLPHAAADAIADHLDHFFRTVIAPDDALRSPVCMRYITGEPNPFGNLAVFRRAAAPADIARDAAPLSDGAFPSAIAFLNQGTAEQLDAVEKLGFAHGESMPLMSVTPATLAKTTLPAGYAFREVSTDDSPAWADTVSAGYGLPRSVGAMMSPAQAAARCPGATHYYAIEHEGAMVATSVAYLHDGFAGIYGVATLPDHRGKGLGAHLTAEPLRLAWSEGYATGLLQASEMGAPVYARLGFQTHGHMEMVVRMPS